MATVLTLHHGAAQRTFAEHPVEVARRALREAAEIEEREAWAGIYRRVANSLPDRSGVVVPAGGDA